MPPSIIATTIVSPKGVTPPVGREFVKATLYKDEDLTDIVSERTITYNIVKTILPPYVCDPRKELCND